MICSYLKILSKFLICSPEKEYLMIFQCNVLAFLQTIFRQESTLILIVQVRDGGKAMLKREFIWCYCGCTTEVPDQHFEGAIVPISKAYSIAHFTHSQEYAVIWLQGFELADMIKRTDGVYLSTRSLYLAQNPNNQKHSSLYQLY